MVPVQSGLNEIAATAPRSEGCGGRTRPSAAAGWQESWGGWAAPASRQGQAGGPSILAGRRVCVCVIGFINTFDSQSYDTNDFHCKYNAGPLNKKKGYKCVCVCVCVCSSPAPIEGFGVP
jgi:hypothetical protein